MDNLEPDPTSIVARSAELVGAHYLFAEVGDELARQLRDGVAAGRYDGLSAAELAAAVTTDLQQINGDRHLRLKHHLDSIVDLEDDEAEFEFFAAQAAEAMYGVRRVERLAANVGVLELGPVLFPATLAGDTISAALRIVASTDALLLDLRGLRGGDPGTVALVCSYLLGGEPVHLNTMFPRDSADGAQSWTLPWVPGARYRADRPIWVLTGSLTFSGGEELSYDLQQLGRATVVGEVTGGGAHARRGFTLHPHLELSVPVVRAENPISHTNWETVGVTPDISVPTTGDALDTAYQLALAHIAGTDISPALRREIADAQGS